MIQLILKGVHKKRFKNLSGKQVFLLNKMCMGIMTWGCERKMDKRVMVSVTV